MYNLEKNESCIWLHTPGINRFCLYFEWKIILLLYKANFFHTWHYIFWHTGDSPNKVTFMPDPALITNGLNISREDTFLNPTIQRVVVFVHTKSRIYFYFAFLDFMLRRSTAITNSSSHILAVKYSWAIWNTMSRLSTVEAYLLTTQCKLPVDRWTHSILFYLKSHFKLLIPPQEEMLPLCS